MEKTLSICVAVYNIKEEFLRECIESITADQSPDIEIILGDDCSENNSGRICMEYEKKDSRIKYICPQKNGGVSAMRNLMIQAAEGKWIVFADGDDAVVASYVKTLKEQASSACDIICFQWQRFSGELPKISDKDEKLTLIDPDACMEFSKACLTGAPPQLEKYGMENSTPSSVCNKAYRREFLTDSSLYFREGMKKAQDVEFNPRAFFCCKKLGYIPKIMYLYRTNPDSICNRYSRDYEKIAEDIMKYDMENLETLFGGDEELREQWGNYKLLHLIIDNFGLNIFHCRVADKSYIVVFHGQKNRYDGHTHRHRGDIYRAVCLENHSLLWQIPQIKQPCGVFEKYCLCRRGVSGMYGGGVYHRENKHQKPLCGVCGFWRYFLCRARCGEYGDVFKTEEFSYSAEMVLANMRRILHK